MVEFLTQNASALFGLGGALGAVCLTFLTRWLLRKRDYDLRLWDRLLERRIDAHERLINVAIEMRVMVGLGGLDEEREVVRAPQVLISKEVFEDWCTRAVGSGVAPSTWLSIAAKREANFLQDYLVTLKLNLEHIPSDKYLAVGAIIRQDFVEISAQLERTAYSFFERDIRKLRLDDLSEWHKYPRERTEERLKKTQLISRFAELAQLADRENERNHN